MEYILVKLFILLALSLEFAYFVISGFIIFMIFILVPFLFVYCLELGLSSVNILSYFIVLNLVCSF